jgi:hypothetical protein
MLQRGLYYAASTVMICAVGAALLQVASQILSFSSPLADAAASLAATGILLGSLHRRRGRVVAKHHQVRATAIRTIEAPAASVGTVRQDGNHHRGASRLADAA